MWGGERSGRLEIVFQPYSPSNSLEHDFNEAGDRHSQSAVKPYFLGQPESFTSDLSIFNVRLRLRVHDRAIQSYTQALVCLMLLAHLLITGGMML
ncbi:hypothetical protein SD70_04520 [Gordoniibacillus kamchatkensis]|uniref:Uncharacterized protein n=1 Tax=Gordoniibacillus kamchatkensis TaxID=1590651 RepID=A0ABR5ALF4_9BACL|nr:hypothetical protein SD70_04520 [Paenibacillus sp. VKM B-2647]